MPFARTLAFRHFDVFRGGPDEEGAFVEFSVPDASPSNVAHCVSRGVHVVVGTTGWSPDRLVALREQATEALGS